MKIQVGRRWTGERQDGWIFSVVDQAGKILAEKRPVGNSVIRATELLLRLLIDFPGAEVLGVEAIRESAERDPVLAKKISEISS